MNEESKGLVLIDAEEFMAKLGLRSESRFYELAKKDQRFPKAIKRGKRYSRWVLAEADNYIRELIRERDAQPVAA
jgi:predicted DNA-binding transcriptional regulator AlpA